MSSPTALDIAETAYSSRRHAAVRTEHYIFSQLIPYLGNKRKLLPLIERGIAATGCTGGTFVDLFTGSTVVARMAKTQGFRVAANDWEPYAYEIALGTVATNAVPGFRALGGVDAVFAHLNALPPRHGYVAKHLCPRDDDAPDPAAERMFFTRANGERIDAIREEIAAWDTAGLLTPAERAYLLSALLYAVSYASNTSGLFKGFHHGWGGKTGTALYRIRGALRLAPPPLFDNALPNLAARCDAQTLAGDLDSWLGERAAIVYLDPPYNQHPYGSNYHVLNTVALWDQPPLHPTIQVNGSPRDKSAIRKDWRTERRSPYNAANGALPALQTLLARIAARWLLVSYSTDGNIPTRDLLAALAGRGELSVFTQPYKRYRVSTPRMSPRPRTVEFLAVLDLEGSPSTARLDALTESVLRHDRVPTSGEVTVNADMR